MIHRQLEMPKLYGNILVDETMWSHSPITFETMDLTKHQRQLWLFGLIQEDGEIAKIFNVTNRTTSTLKKLIRDNCEPGSIIHSDGWAAYQAIPWEILEMTHVRHVKKSANSEEIRTFKHSNLIEGLWGNLKAHIKHSYNTLIGDEDTYFSFI
jgi:IS1 family transposase